ncbi:sigma-54 interaction domain-containing protein [Acanthopleuribacter pedis]|uniref:Sigma 54-interacting transcriptional regulator n=1 Tax=Acanthopleuribacter pedis TaxID=442870 RepID=A0A8J7U2E8_9BACT|nr:sigma 54-interacting transcriptional regulator [Acanthopleuribacter pedis]MBO1317188.1 sigma 54-interacting transcriptional regulator [Acanthopleuribacter pedis]
MIQPMGPFSRSVAALTGVYRGQWTYWIRTLVGETNTTLLAEQQGLFVRSASISPPADGVWMELAEWMAPHLSPQALPAEQVAPVGEEASPEEGRLLAALEVPGSTGMTRLFVGVLNRKIADWDCVGLQAFHRRIRARSSDWGEQAGAILRRLQGLPPVNMGSGRSRDGLDRALVKVFQFKWDEACVRLNRYAARKSAPLSTRCYALVLAAEQAALRGKIAKALAARGRFLELSTGLPNTETATFWSCRIDAACVEAEFRGARRLSVTRAFLAESAAVPTHDPGRRWLAAVGAACLEDPFSALDHLLWLIHHPELVADLPLQWAFLAKTADLYTKLNDGVQARFWLARGEAWARSEGVASVAQRFAMRRAVSFARDGLWCEATALAWDHRLSDSREQGWPPALMLAHQLVFGPKTTEAAEHRRANSNIAIQDELARCQLALLEGPRLGTARRRALWAKVKEGTAHPSLSASEVASSNARFLWLADWLTLFHPATPAWITAHNGQGGGDFENRTTLFWGAVRLWFKAALTALDTAVPKDCISGVNNELSPMPAGCNMPCLPGFDEGEAWDRGLLALSLQALSTGPWAKRPELKRAATFWLAGFSADHCLTIETDGSRVDDPTGKPLAAGLTAPMSAWCRARRVESSDLSGHSPAFRAARNQLKRALNQCLRQWLLFVGGLEYGAFLVDMRAPASAWRPLSLVAEKPAAGSWRETVRRRFGNPIPADEADKTRRVMGRVARYQCVSGRVESATASCVWVPVGDERLLMWWLVHPSADPALQKGVFRKVAALARLSRSWWSWVDAFETPSPVASGDTFGIVGRGAALRGVLADIRRFAVSDLPVFIGGETGTGKELAARAVHRASARSQRPFFALNCSQYPENLIESHLFGYRKGSFTDAHEDRPGLLEHADGGTLFLDEVGDISAKVQSLLLRVLQEGEFTRVGEPTMRRVDVRFVTATNAPLADLVAQGAFRADLYYRLMGVALDLPPLRERLGDIPLLVNHLMGKHAPDRRISCDPAVFTALQQHVWPGNIRELEMYVRRLLAAFPEETCFVPAHLPPFLPVPTEVSPDDEAATLKVLERQYRARLLTRRLAAFGGNRTAAAESLGISRQHFVHLLNRL